jgi:hypothetical protein
MMCHMIEEVLPKEFYTNMLAITADINVIMLFLEEKMPELIVHFKKLHFELPMILVELLITLFTVNKTELSDLVIDALLLEGSTAYFKVVLLFFEYYERELLEIDDFRRFSSNLAAMLTYIKNTFKTNFQNLDTFKTDLCSFYLSRFFLEELRQVFMEKERVMFAERRNPFKVPGFCIDSESSVCFRKLHTVPVIPERAKVSIFRTTNILKNFKADHFLHSELPGKHDSRCSEEDANEQSMVNPMFTNKSLWTEGGSSVANQSETSPTNSCKIFPAKQDPLLSEDVLMERQIHSCEFREPCHTRSRRLYDIHHKLLSQIQQVEEIQRDSTQASQEDYRRPSKTIDLREDIDAFSATFKQSVNEEEDNKTINDFLDTMDVRTPLIGHFSKNRKKTFDELRYDVS